MFAFQNNRRNQPRAPVRLPTHVVWAGGEADTQLLLISDPTAGAGVILESTRIRGIIRGAVSGKVEINNLTADSRIKPGEQVLDEIGRPIA